VRKGEKGLRPRHSKEEDTLSEREEKGASKATMSRCGEKPISSKGAQRGGRKNKTRCLGKIYSSPEEGTNQSKGKGVGNTFFNRKRKSHLSTEKRDTRPVSLAGCEELLSFRRGRQNSNKGRGFFTFQKQFPFRDRLS